MMVIHRQFTELLFKEFLILTQKSPPQKKPQKKEKLMNLKKSLTTELVNKGFSIKY